MMFPVPSLRLRLIGQCPLWLRSRSHRRSRCLCENFVNTFKPTNAETGAVVSVFTGGAFFGAFFAGPAGDYLGRKKTILLGALIFILGGGLQTGAQALSYLYAGRGRSQITVLEERYGR